ncbi:MAG: hypothetical protein GTO24_21610 [candidate division Zixibacteria bacterium]|nr:hypothetical protein [candidate division Zixibacteria bacterium]
MKVKRGILYILLILMIPALSGCWYAVAAGAGAAGGYLMRDSGYKVQKPIEKETER